MADPGRLVVLEGPDGVGKSALSEALASKISQRGIPCSHLSFPGRGEGTLGRHIYALHHDPGQFGITSLAPESLQLLHIAAHLDAISGQILPAIRNGHWVILDRYWWSTWVYGRVSGADRATLDAMIDVERAAWRGIVPSPVFLIRRDEPFRLEGDRTRHRSLSSAYDEIARAETGRYPVHVLENDGQIDSLAETALAVIDGIRFRAASPPARTRRAVRSTNGRPNELTDLFSEPTEIPARKVDTESTKRAPRSQFTIVTPLAPAQPTDVYGTYWSFAAKRQEIFFRRIERKLPITDDPILARHKFTNAYRASDRVSQFLIREVIYGGDQDPEEVFFRTILFKLFNKIATWKLLESTLGFPVCREFDVERYAAVLDLAMNRGERIYSAAYIMPSGSGAFEDSRKHRSHLRLLETIVREQLALRIADCRSMREAFELFRSHQMIGDFLAYQFVTDLNYSTLTEFSESAFVIPGPGARDGIRKCFKSLGGLDEAGIIRRVTECQEEEFARLGIGFRSLWTRPLQFIDCQNLFCEVDKYARIAHPDIKGISGRTKIKQIYTANPDPIDYWYPPKWGINELVRATLKKLGKK
jgi:thymidylate kinase